MTRARSLVIVVALVTGLTLGPAIVAAELEDPRFEVYTPEPTVTPGSTADLTLQVVNDAEDPEDSVRRARNVRATLLPGKTDFSVQSGTRVVGDFPDGDLRELSFRVRIPENASSGTHTLRLQLEYEFNQPDNDIEEETVTIPVEVVIEDRPRFRVVGTASDAPVGDTGTVDVTITNVGTEAVTDASVTLASEHTDIQFGGSNAASRFVGPWQPGENRTVSYSVAVAEGADTRTYALTATVQYDDAGGNAGTSRPLSLGLTPLAEQSFAVSEVSSTLRVGEEGDVAGTLTNDGPLDAGDVVVRFVSENPNVNPQETEFAVGDLAAGESAAFRFRAEVSENADAGPRQLTFGIEYENAEGDTRESDPQTARVEVAPQRDRFTVEPKAATVEAGSSGSVTLVVTNNGEERVSNVNAKMFVNAPLSADDDEAFVASLGPGESREVTFGVSSAASARAKTYPLQVDFQYETPDGDLEISKAYQLPVTVTKPENGDGLPVPLPAVAVGAVVVVAGSYLWFRRSRADG